MDIKMDPSKLKSPTKSLMKNTASDDNNYFIKFIMTFMTNPETSLFKQNENQKHFR